MEPNEKKLQRVLQHLRLIRSEKVFLLLSYTSEELIPFLEDLVGRDLM